MRKSVGYQLERRGLQIDGISVSYNNLVSFALIIIIRLFTKRCYFAMSFVALKKQSFFLPDLDLR